jgi:hypothetical protein
MPMARETLGGKPGCHVQLAERLLNQCPFVARRFVASRDRSAVILAILLIPINLRS